VQQGAAQRGSLILNHNLNCLYYSEVPYGMLVDLVEIVYCSIKNDISYLLNKALSNLLGE